jgi:flagellar assembly factor FliW
VTKLELSWLVGFYEGEGSCGCYKFSHKRKNKVYRYYNLSASIAQKEKQVIKLIRRLLGFGRINQLHLSGINKITMWRWKVNNKEARKFLNLIRPHMKHPGKIRQLKNAVSLDLKNVNPNYHKVGRK